MSKPVLWNTVTISVVWPYICKKSWSLWLSLGAKQNFVVPQEQISPLPDGAETASQKGQILNRALPGFGGFQATGNLSVSTARVTFWVGWKRASQVVRRFAHQPKVNFYPQDREAGQCGRAVRRVLRLYLRWRVDRWGHSKVALAGI